jgi:uncharacterized protein YecE (DUF72 family)
VIVFQCPASFLPTRENVRNLEAFFQEIDRGGRTLAWEPRGEAWSNGLILDLCSALDLVDCVDPLKREAVHGETLYWRLHGRGGYRYHYTDEDLAEIRGMLERREGLDGPRYILFNNMSSREDAARFMASVSGLMKHS